MTNESSLNEMVKEIQNYLSELNEKELEDASDSTDKSKQVENDPVNHPSHYTKGGFECIDAMIASQGIEAVKDFCVCNAFKYVFRHREKNHVEDIKKAKWYLNKYLELCEG